MDWGPPHIQGWTGTPLPRPRLKAGSGPPLNVNRQTPVKTVPSRRTTYAGGNYVTRNTPIVDLYRRLNKLGVSSKEGIGVVMRQTFYGGNYGLISGITPTTVAISLLLYLDLTLTCKAVCCAIFNKLHHHIFLSCELTQGGAPCDEAAH